jgi:hypothetical protein
MHKSVRVLFTFVLLIALGAGAVLLIWDWQITLAYFAFAVALALIVASAVFLPAFVVLLVRERALSSAWTKSWRLWGAVFSTVLEQL